MVLVLCVVGLGLIPISGSLGYFMYLHLTLMGVRCSSMVEHQLVVQWVIGSIPYNSNSNNNNNNNNTVFNNTS